MRKTLLQYGRNIPDRIKCYRARDVSLRDIRVLGETLVIIGPKSLLKKDGAQMLDIPQRGPDISPNPYALSVPFDMQGRVLVA